MENTQFLLPFERKIHKILIKKEAQTADKYGYKPFNRPIDLHMKLGIVNIDKPKGPTSLQV